jgi:hypothetical protein
MKDFTLIIYKKLLSELLNDGFQLATFEEYVQKPDKKEKTIVLRHDVDKKPVRALKMAELEREMGVRGTYYFRVLKSEVPAEVIRIIAAMGHEIGYHYEDVDTARGDMNAAWASFQENLARLRAIAPVSTVCMHGSPLSRHDNRDLWKRHDYRRLGLIGEPYLDVDFSRVLYITDTGRRWDGDRVSIRDRVSGFALDRGQRTEDRGQKAENREEQEKGSRGAVSDPPVFGQEEAESSQKPEVRMNVTDTRPKYHSTHDIIHALRNRELPGHIMLTIHPQRWAGGLLPWLRELVWQNAKNSIKMLIRSRSDPRPGGSD